MRTEEHITEIQVNAVEEMEPIDLRREKNHLLHTALQDGVVHHLHRDIVQEVVHQEVPAVVHLLEDQVHQAAGAAPVQVHQAAGEGKYYEE